MVKSYSDLLREARTVVTEVEPAAAAASDSAVILDVREPDEVSQGAVDQSVLIPRGNLESTVAARIPDAGTPIITMCAGGARSLLAARTLQSMGYTNVQSMAGGFDRWKREGLAWSTPRLLNSDQRTRYGRHLLLPEVGEEGQQRLLDSSVLLIGAGGLGSPAALYLAAAGVGTLGIVDSDAVDASNLQRQIIHSLDRIGMDKTASAKEAIASLNPDCSVVAHQTRLDASNVLDIMKGYDVIVDGGDNFPTRYLVNDASLHLETPVVHGSIFRFDGQLSVFDPYNGPCYRCLFPEPPPPELAPSCAEAGVLGVLPGIIGSLEAMEAIKLVLQIGEPLIGRLLIYDALEEDFSTVKVARNPDCLACGDGLDPPPIVDYDDTCSVVRPVVSI